MKRTFLIIALIVGLAGQVEARSRRDIVLLAVGGALVVGGVGLVCGAAAAWHSSVTAPTLTDFENNSSPITGLMVAGTLVALAGAPMVIVGGLGLAEDRYQARPAVSSGLSGSSWFHQEGDGLALVGGRF